MSRLQIMLLIIAVAATASVVFYHIEYNKLNEAYVDLAGRYNDLVVRYNDLHSAYVKLSGEHDALHGEYDRLEAAYRRLNVTYHRLAAEHKATIGELERVRGQYAVLESLYAALQKNYTALRDLHRGLQLRLDKFVYSYNQWRDWYMTFIDWRLSVGRVLSDGEVKALEPLVRRVTDPKDWYWSIFAMYRYVVKNVEYTHDVYMPVPPTVEDLEAGRTIRKTIDNHAQTPRETLERGAGDCDDMAILLFAMITAYERYVWGKEYVKWLMYIEFEDSAHLAVAIPIGENPTKLMIVDPAGEYYTGMPGGLTYREPLDELQRYAAYWAQDGHKLVYIAIYRVRGGKAELLVDGDIYKVADYIRKY
ncbi:MAG: transglutaminase-like domain-containing protein [Pyrobaculum sp.]